MVSQSDMQQQLILLRQVLPPLYLLCIKHWPRGKLPQCVHRPPCSSLKCLLFTAAHGWTHTTFVNASVTTSVFLSFSALILHALLSCYLLPTNTIRLYSGKWGFNSVCMNSPSLTNSENSLEGVLLSLNTTSI